MISERTTPRAYDLVAIDIDGTLLNSQGELSSGAQEALEQARERGVVVSLVSGRGKQALLPYLQELELRTPYVASGGAYLADPVSGAVIFHEVLPWEDACVILELGRSAQASIAFESPDWLLVELSRQPLDWLRRPAKIRVEFVADLLSSALTTPTKISVMGAPGQLSEVERQVRNRMHSPAMTYTSPNGIDFYAEGVDKGTGVRRLARHLGIPLRRVAVLGDFRNDIAMFAVAGLAVAMGNAPADVRAAADLVAPSNDEGGVAWALTQHVLV